MQYHAWMQTSAQLRPRPDAAPAEERHPFLTGLGERVRTLRARRGLTRKSLALAADMSERHLANLELGVGNASILILLQVANALQCPLAELLGDVTTSSPDWLLLRELLERRDEATLRRVRGVVAELLGPTAAAPSGRKRGVAVARCPRLALIGLRGAGKSTLGARLAADLRCPFVELSAEIEKQAGGSVAEIQALYGAAAYRRHERRALEAVIQAHPRAVIAVPGGLVSDAGSFSLLLAQCTTVWLQADPEDHMRRVVAQGDMRPIAASRQALQDLKSILAARAAFYAQAEFRLDTSALPERDAFTALRDLVRAALSLPASPASPTALGRRKKALP